MLAYGGCPQRQELILPDRIKPREPQIDLERSSPIISNPFASNKNIYAEDYPHWCWKPGIYPKSLQRYLAGDLVYKTAPSA